MRLSPVALLLLLASTAFSQEGFSFLPGSLLFPPLTANNEEPRLGIRKEIGSSQMKLDIGGVFEFLEYRSEAYAGRIGMEFFAYGLTTSARGLRLQVDALDGYFGGYIGVISLASPTSLSLRLRLMHLSSHMVDGHMDGNGAWSDGIPPTPYTRDFGELNAGIAHAAAHFYLLTYLGTSYSTLVRPDDLARWGGLAGVELWTTDFPGSLFGRPATLFLADHFTLAGIPTYVGSNNLEGGIKFGTREGSGIRIYTSYSTGLRIFHQYYTQRRNSWGLGIAFDVR